jgi:hypothetical protein
MMDRERFDFKGSHLGEISLVEISRAMVALCLERHMGPKRCPNLDPGLEDILGGPGVVTMLVGKDASGDISWRKTDPPFHLLEIDATLDKERLLVEITLKEVAIAGGA